MSSINITNVTYPRPNTATQLAVNSFSVEGVYIDLEHEILSESNNINFKVIINYIDKNTKEVYEPYNLSIVLNNDNIYAPNSFSDIVSLCGLQKNILDQLKYELSLWNNTSIYILNTMVSYAVDPDYPTNLYPYMAIKSILIWDPITNYNQYDIILYNDIYYQSLASNNIGYIPDGDGGTWVECLGYPNLYTNYWQLEEWNSYTKYGYGHLVYYNNVYYDTITYEKNNTQITTSTPSRKGIYMCNSLSATETFFPYNNSSQWLLQNWDSTITYTANFLVYFTPSGGSQTLYISLANSLGMSPDTNPSYWQITQWEITWTSDSTFNIYNPVSYLSYIYTSLINNNTSQPNLNLNSWQLQPWVPVTSYAIGNIVYYSNLVTKGIYTCLVSGITVAPYNNLAQWTLQTWSSEITYSKDYLVYYPTSLSNLYIAVDDNTNTNTNITPGTNSSYWQLTSWTQTWNSTEHYYINSKIIYTSSNEDYTYNCLESFIVTIDNTTTPSTKTTINNINKEPNLYTNYWVLNSWDNTMWYPQNYLVYYNNSIKITKTTTSSRQGIYKCLTNNVPTFIPYNNSTEWELQTWNSLVTYLKNYLVYYTPEGGIQTLYISMSNTNFNITPGTDISYWTETQWEF
jgi:hypothetical protein